MKKQLRLIVSAILLSVLGSATANAQVAALPFTASLDTFNVISGTTLDSPGVDDVVYQGIPIVSHLTLPVHHMITCL